jgi:hypothetical protein
LAIADDAVTTRGFQFIELKYTVETGEAERIAVDGAAKAGDEDGSGGSACKRSSCSCGCDVDSPPYSGYKLDDAKECGGDVT